jgi:hypothetical protein
MEEDDDFSLSLTPEENLLVAVFVMALKDALSGITVEQNIKRSAFYYFDNFDTKEYGSFGFFCLHFNLDPLEARVKALDGASLDILIQTGKIGK